MHSLSTQYKKILNHLHLVRDFLLDLIFPISCISCKLGETYLCNECKDKIIINKKFHCPDCKKSTNLGHYCPSCQTNYELDGLWISSDYQNKILSTLIKKFKYSPNKKLAPILSELIIVFITENNLTSKSDLFKNLKNLIIIPVPLHKNKLRFRGFNQSEEIARLIAKEFKLNLNTEDLIRHQNTKPQAKLNKQQRQHNTANAFSWMGEPLKNKNIILIDDVSSTGATLNNCAKPLKLNGAKSVWGLVLAKN